MAEPHKAIAQEIERLKNSVSTAPSPGVGRKRKYDSTRDRVAANKRALSAKASEIEIPPVVNPERRARCEKDLLLFGRTYFPALYYLPQAEFQIRRISKIQELVRYGGQTADAEPRGTGKTTDALIAGLWATMCGHSQHFFIVRANQREAEELIRGAKLQMETNDSLLEDFPEICAPIRALEGAPQRAGAQTVDGIQTRMQYKSDYIVLPTVVGSKASGNVLSSTGITGKIRGRNINSRRPNFVLLDDIEDPESVESESTSGKLERLVLADIGGLAGAGKKITTLWRGTILRRGCLIDRYTNPQEHPEWQGSRQAALVSFPDNQELWDEYAELMRRGKAEGEDATGRDAMAFYQKNRKSMDAGAVVAWPDNYVQDEAPDGSPLEISALQHLMNERIRIGDEAFNTEYQNDPPEVEGDEQEIEVASVIDRLSLVEQFVAPPDVCQRIVQGIDLRARQLHYVVIAFSGDATASVIDYGADRLDSEFEEVDLSKPDRETRLALIDATRVALDNRQAICQREYVNEEGMVLPVDLTLIDSGYAETQQAVYDFCKAAGSAWRPSKGQQQAKGNTRYRAPQKRKKTEKYGDHWHSSYLVKHKIRLWFLNADHWKLFAQERLRQDIDTEGALTLFGDNGYKHLQFAKHMASEVWNPIDRKFKVVSKRNHWLDCVAECYAAADMLGCRLGAPKEIRQKSGDGPKVAGWADKPNGIQSGRGGGGWLK